MLTDKQEENYQQMIDKHMETVLSKSRAHKSYGLYHSQSVAILTKISKEMKTLGIKGQIRQIYNTRFLKHIQEQVVDFKEWLFMIDPACGICEKPIEDMRQANLDHIVPKSKGGSNARTNLQLAHIKCNGNKGNTLPNLRLNLGHKFSRPELEEVYLGTKSNS